MSEFPLLEGILKYSKENNIPFSMPGHKGGRGFINTAEGKELYNNIIKCDITEVDGTDNLHHPVSIIKRSLELLSSLYGSRKSYFLVNGSTSGILTMIFSCFNENDKIIVDRSCHKSVFNAIILRKLNPVYVDCKIHTKYGFPLGIKRENLFSVIENNKDAKGIIVTYPNYYGVCVNLKEISEKAEKYNMKVLVDAAHGAHFGVCDGLPESAVKLGADAVVMSSHKTLPAFTQTAYLHLNNMELEDKFDFYINCFLSTSPSYMLMCSMDYARYYLETQGKKDFEELISRAEYYRKKINKLSYFHVVSKNDIEAYGDFYSFDVTRYVLNVHAAIDINKFLEYLKENKIQIEMCDGHNVILILAPFNGNKDFEILYTVLKSYISQNGILKDSSEKHKFIMEYNMEYKNINKNENEDMHTEYGVPLYKAAEAKKVLTHYKKSVGRICGDFITPYPPGIPVILPGEFMDYNKVEIINSMLKNKINILGINNGFIKVLDL